MRPGRNSAERVAVVTGGTGGIGKAVTRRLAEDGFAVVVFSRGAAGSEVRGARLQLKVDITDAEQVEKAFRTVAKKFGGVYALVNAAGVSGPIGPVEEISLRDWNETLAVNLTGAFLTCKFAAPAMVKAGEGRIVNIASMVGKRPTPFRSAYSASKLGLIGMTRSLSRELGRFGVTVNAVCPGAVKGDRIERVIEETASASGEGVESVKKRLLGASSSGSFVTAGDVAEAVAFLVSDGAAKVTGQEIEVV